MRGEVRVRIVVTYDVNTETAAGRKRLRQVAKCCVAHGQRVQNSVFECSLDEAQFVALRGQLESIIDLNKDSLRFTIWEKLSQVKLSMLELRLDIIQDGKS